MTSKTISFIIWKIRTDLPDLFNRIPKNNSKYTGKADYRQAILEDKLKPMSQANAQNIIQLIKDQKSKEVELYIFGIMGLNPKYV